MAFATAMMMGWNIHIPAKNTYTLAQTTITETAPQNVGLVLMKKMTFLQSWWVNITSNVKLDSSDWWSSIYSHWTIYAYLYYNGTLLDSLVWDGNDNSKTLTKNDIYVTAGSTVSVYASSKWYATYLWHRYDWIVYDLKIKGSYNIPNFATIDNP